MVQSLSGQTASTAGMNYQAVARDVFGKLLAKQTIALKISFSSGEGEAKSHYSEIHQVTTDELGLFNLVIGEGQDASGKLSDIPWATDQIRLNVALDAAGGREFALMGSSELHSVPYAYYATTASQLVDESSAIELPTEKNQSIYWHTGGNTATRPETHFLGTRDNQSLVFKTNNTTRVILTAGGQMQVYSGVSGNDSDPASYPITVEGSQQGIYVMVNESRDGDNNFLTFADPEGIWGRVEGQTIPELEASQEYRTQVALFTLSAVSLAATLVATIAEAAGLYAAAVAAAATLILAFATPGFTAAAVAVTANGVSIGVEAAALATEWATWESNIKGNIGVTYQSGAGDYAEWLQRGKDEPDMHFGEIVGVSGGKISLNTNNAQHYMVVSRRPIVLGNAPQPDREHLYEKVAFMGQVPVKVVGKVDVGDYIIPSGNNDGLGVAVKPSQMMISDYAKVVGVAWEAAKEAPLNYVNIGVGLTTNDLAPKVEDLSHKVDNIIAYLEGKAPLRSSTAKAVNPVAAPAAQPASAKMVTDEEFDQFLDKNADLVNQIYAQTKQELLRQGSDLSNYPELQAMFDDPIPAIKKMRRDPQLVSQWAMVDKKIQKELKKK
ncbi:hypothetical protein Halhy_0315 [Haliscomenobacter hydrossis DSM 1100]|uniref:Uncharacterized protein n=2 Tax=Haliscomenobacter TaxID=2349 RepID=F4KW29_HALH1|nr:hypothetical protein Halhy_0315 [Haliscomenobacter hydrossis DSM 1100]